MPRRLPPLVAVLALLVVAVPVFARHVEPRFTSEAESCGPLAPGTVEFLVEASELGGTLGDDAFSVDVSVEGTLEGGSLGFSAATLPVRAAFVAGTDGGNVYEYAEPVTEDDGLVAPDGQAITNVSFCYVEADATPEPTEQASPDATADTAAATEEAGPGTTAPPTDTDATSIAAPLGPALLVAAGVAILSLGLGLAVAPVTASVRRRRR